MLFAAEIPKKKKPNCFDIYSVFADSPALTVQGGGRLYIPVQGGNTYLQGLLSSCFSIWSALSMRCVHLVHGRWSRLSVLSVAAGALATVASLAAPSHAGTITFGSGANQFQMEFVTIGNAGNAADTAGVPLNPGAVDREYGLGKFEVSEDMITKFNASQSLQITKDTRGTAKPATSVSWNEAARFVNWLNTSTGGFAAYNFTTSGVNDNIAVWTAADALDYDIANPYRSKRATYVLPNSNEWYKAAYYNPTNSTYYEFPNGSNTVPTAVASGTDAGSAVYGGGSVTGPADVDQAGGPSPYGVMGLGGNVYEWEESSFDGIYSSGSQRVVRGGSWDSPLSANDLASGKRYAFAPSVESNNFGFRVASLPSSAAAVPEPSMMVIGTLFGLGGLMAKRRMKK
jgi:formylglycine-generating enzyme required for sulfatase activity